MKILVIEDEALIRNLYASYFARWGYRYVMFQNGEEFLSLKSYLIPDVVVLDWKLSGMDGSEVLNMLREDPDYKAVPVVVVSAHQLDHLSSTDYLRVMAKPIDFAKFQEILEEMKNICPVKDRRFFKRCEPPADARYYFKEQKVQIKKAKNISLHGACLLFSPGIEHKPGQIMQIMQTILKKDKDANARVCWVEKTSEGVTVLGLFIDQQVIME